MTGIGGLAASPKQVAAFKTLLKERGAEVLTTTNEWELARFVANGETHVIYKNKQGALSFSGAGARQAWQAYRTGNGKLFLIGGGSSKGKVSKHAAAVIERDGTDCFYCLRPVETDDVSMEHLVARSAGGPPHLANLVLTHALCNQEAGSLSVFEKIRRREKTLRRHWEGGERG